jgi:hypothetical protein
MTAQGHPRAIFKRAVEHGNLLVAEMTARELGRITLAEALELVCLYADAEPAKFERAAFGGTQGLSLSPGRHCFGRRSRWPRSLSFAAETRRREDCSSS